MSKGISLEKFREKLKIIADLTGQRVTVDTSKALWERLGEKTEWSDFEEAAEAMGNNDIKITLGALNQHIQKFQTKRLERENLFQKYKNEEEVREWFESHRGTKDTCINLSADGSSKCYDCKRIYCSIVGAAACESIKKCLTEKNIDMKNIHKELSNRFRGLGFENNVPESQAF